MLLLAVVLIITVGAKIFDSGDNTGIGYYDEDTVIMQVEGGDMLWSEYYGWLCYSKIQTEAEYGTITDWSEYLNSSQTYADYVKDRAVYFIAAYKSVEANAAAIGIKLTDDEKQEIADVCGKMTDAEKKAVSAAYGSVEFYQYLSELTALYNKCHDWQYGENGENTEDEYVMNYADQNGVAAFYGMLIGSSADVTAAEISAQLDSADDKKAMVDALREKYSVDDEYSEGYLVYTDEFDTAASSKLIELDIGESTVVTGENGIWVMLRCEVTEDGIIYDTGETLQYTASWSIFDSVVQGWSENIKLTSRSAYEKIDISDVFR